MKRPEDSITAHVAWLNRQTQLAAESSPLGQGPEWLRSCALGLAAGWRGWRMAAAEPGWARTVRAMHAGLFPWLAAAKRWERSLLPDAAAVPLSDAGAPALEPSLPGSQPAGADRERLTVLLITKNEERRISRCLASASWADEIVVVDGQSTDRTTELCRRAGATVVSRAFSGSFAQERNAGLDVATGDWVLQMDADELITPGLRAAIEAILRQPDRRYQAYQVRRRNLFLGRFMRYGGWYHHHLCLFRREGRRYSGLVHEQLNLDGPAGRLDADLQHEPFQSLAQFIDRQNRYTTLQACQLLDAQGRLPWRAVGRMLWRLPVKRWWKFYVKKRGYREGAHGWVFSVLFAWVDFLVWAKYAELLHATRHDEAR